MDMIALTHIFGEVIYRMTPLIWRPAVVGYLRNLTATQVEQFVAECKSRGVTISLAPLPATPGGIKGDPAG